MPAPDVFNRMFNRRTREDTPTPHLMEELEKPKIDKPSWGNLASLIAYAVCMALAGAFFLVSGMPVIGVGLIAFALIPPALMLVMASQSLPQFMGPRKDVDKGGQLGEYLGEGGDVAVRELSPALSAEELDIIEANRAAEADATFRWMTSLSSGWDFEDVELNANDGAVLAGHVLRCSPGSDRWLIYVHGLNGGWRTGMTFARHYAEAGFNLLFVELRGHGASGGDWVGSGWLDKTDVVDWCQWLVLREGSDVKIVLAGISMGAASIVMAAGEDDLPSQVKACVSDSAYTDFWNVAVTEVTKIGPSEGRAASAHPLVDLMRFMLLIKKGGYDIAKARPVDAIACSKVPVLLIHGEDDQVVPVRMADELAEAAGGAAAGEEGHELLKVPSAGHCASSLADPDAYWGAVLPFVERCL